MLPTFRTLVGLITTVIAFAATSIQAATVYVYANQFSPSSLQINVGETVTWVNEDEDVHAVASNTGAWPTQYLFDYGDSFSITFNAAGTYGYNDPVNGFSGSITVLGAPANQPPIVSITSPTNNQVFFSTASIVLTATALDTDGSVASVQFTRNGVVLTNDSASPYIVTLTNLAAGNHLLAAIATDNLGLKATNSVTVTVNSAPSVSISSPANNTKVAAPGSFTLTASAADTDGSITNVSFYSGPGTTLLGSDTTAPFTLAISSLPAGTYTYYAAATDNRGETKLSTQGVTVHVLARATLSAPTVATNRFALRFNAVIGHSYSVESSTNLSLNSWTTVDTFIAQSNLVQFTDTSSTATSPSKFYRVRSN